MKQSDLKALAYQFVVNAVKAIPGENIWIEYCGRDAESLAGICAEQAKEIGAVPHMFDRGSGYINEVIGMMSAGEIEKWKDKNIADLKQMQGFIRIRDNSDISAVNLNDDVKTFYNKANSEIVDYRVNNTRWLLVTAPNEAFAEQCKMKLAEFEEFYKEACLVNYSEMSKAAEPLVDLLAKGKEVRVYSPAQETDLSFSIEGIPSVACVGKRNLPDGEVYTAPVKNSVNGTIKFSKSFYDGQQFDFIKLEIKNGRIEKAEAENEERTVSLNKILDADDGARYFGEFALNFNPCVLYPTGVTLFDEKISGGIHLAAGRCYDQAPNGNKSVNHWDMVHIQRPEYGGGEVWIDGRLIRKDGIFVVDELKGLNPDVLKKACSGISAPQP